MTAKAPVLIVDDDGWLASRFATLLEGAGCRVFVAANAVEAIEAIDRHRPQVVILDIFMPGRHGILLLHEVRSHSDLADMPIIVCTNSASDIPHGNLTPYGVSTVLDKTTMHPEDVITAVRRVLS